MAHTVGKKVVLIARSEKDIPSDIKHFEYITYNVEGVGVLVGRLRTVVVRLSSAPIHVLPPMTIAVRRRRQVLCNAKGKTKETDS